MFLLHTTSSCFFSLLSHSLVPNLPFIFQVKTSWVLPPHPIIPLKRSKIINDYLFSNLIITLHTLLFMVMDTVVPPYSLKLFIPLSLGLALLVLFLPLANSFSVSIMRFSSPSSILSVGIHEVLSLVPFLSHSLKPFHRISNPYLWLPILLLLCQLSNISLSLSFSESQIHISNYLMENSTQEMTDEI